MQSGWAGKLRLCLPLFPCVRHMFNLVCRQSRVEEREGRSEGAEREQDRQLSNVLLLLAIAVWPQTLQLAIAIV